MARRLLLLLLVGLGASGARAEEDLEDRYRRGLLACKDNGEAAVQVARLKLNTGRPRLLPRLPNLDVSRFCECKFEARRSEFGLEEAVWLEFLTGDRPRTSPEATVALYERDEQLVLDCIELAATGRREFTDPNEARLADLIDGCQHGEVSFNLLVAVFLETKSPEEVRARVAELDRDAVCACFFESQREEFGLEDAVALNSVAGAARTGGPREAKRIMARKTALFESCAAGTEQGTGVALEPQAESELSTDGGSGPAGRTAWRPTTVGLLALLMLTAAVVAVGAMYYRGRPGRAGQRHRRSSTRRSRRP